MSEKSSQIETIINDFKKNAPKGVSVENGGTKSGKPVLIVKTDWSKVPDSLLDRDSFPHHVAMEKMGAKLKIWGTKEEVWSLGDTSIIVHFGKDGKMSAWMDVNDYLRSMATPPGVTMSPHIPARER